MGPPRLRPLSRLLTSAASTTKHSLPLNRSLSIAATPFPRFSPLSNRTCIGAISAAHLLYPPTTLLSVRTFSTLNADQDKEGNRPLKDMILMPGCDFEHWLVVVKKPPTEWTCDEIVDHYVKILAKVVGSEDEARKKIYSVSTKHYFAFGANVSEELSYKLKELEDVRWVFADSYLDAENKNYGGEPFINGVAVPYDPKYHEEWAGNDEKAMLRNKRNDRPHNADSSRNSDRRQQRPEGFQNNPPIPAANADMTGGNMGDVPDRPGGPPDNPGYGHNVPPGNPGYIQSIPPNNVGYGQNVPPSNGDCSRNFDRRQKRPEGFENSPIPAANADRTVGNMGGMSDRPGGPPDNPGYGHNVPPGNPDYRQSIPPNNVGYGQNVPPCNGDRSRNFDRRQQRPEGFQNNPPIPAANADRTGGNMGGMPDRPGGPPDNPGYGHYVPPGNPGYRQSIPPNNVGYGQNVSPSNGGYGQNMPPYNAGYAQNPWFAHNMPPNNMGGAAPNYGGHVNPGAPSNYGGHVNPSAPPNYGGQWNLGTPPMYGGQGNPAAPNYGGQGNPAAPYYDGQGNPTAPNYGGQGNPAAPNYGGQGNRGYPNNAMPNHQASQWMQYPNAQMGQQQNYAPPQRDQPVGAFQSRDIPGRDLPNY